MYFRSMFLGQKYKLNLTAGLQRTSHQHMTDILHRVTTAPVSARRDLSFYYKYLPPNVCPTLFY